MADLTQYVLLPMRGLHVKPSAATESLLNLFETLSAGVKSVNLKKLGLDDFGVAALKKMSLPNLKLPAGTTEAATRLALRCLDAVSENGAKLVELSAEAAQALRRAEPGMRLAPVLRYRTAEAAAPRVLQKLKPAAAGPSIAVKIVVRTRDSGKPVEGVCVTAFTDFANRAGEEAITNSKGEAKLTSLRAGKVVERLYVESPAHGYWGFFKKKVTLKSEMQVALRPLDLSVGDGVRHFYAESAAPTDGEGVKVAVLDTGVDRNHPNLKVSGGGCTVTGEDPGDWGPSAGPHGTHVAGIIAARGNPPDGLMGVAPRADLFSYRVFGADDRAANFAIAKAIDQAVQAGCDLINLSLKYDGDPDQPAVSDEVIRQALEDARDQGVVVIAATGNDGRKRVAFPALDAAALAVSAIGRKGTYPADSWGRSEEQGPYGTDKKDFVAGFSNVGGEVDATGPGVEIISTVPGGYTPMRGTSMATPAVTGLAARLLSRNSKILELPRDAGRTDAIVRLILASCRDLGFKPEYQGDGIPL